MNLPEHQLGYWFLGITADRCLSESWQIQTKVQYVSTACYRSRRKEAKFSFPLFPSCRWKLDSRWDTSFHIWTKARVGGAFLHSPSHTERRVVSRQHLIGDLNRDIVQGLVCFMTGHQMLEQAAVSTWMPTGWELERRETNIWAPPCNWFVCPSEAQGETSATWR